VLIARILLCSIVLALASKDLLAEPARLTGTGQIPVLAWSAIPQQDTSDARYREMADCGFTIGFSGFSNVAEARKAMDAAHAAGIQVLVSCPQLASDPEGTTRQLMDHPGLAGYFIRDEPPVSEFAAEAKWISKIRSVDPGHIIYGNLLPDYATPAQLGVPTYPEYVDRYVAGVKTTFLSFDYYPIIGTTVRPSWYSNLGVIADAAKKADKPFWAFALSVKHFGYAAATKENLRLQVFSDLAYGAQGIQYFTYWYPASLGGSDAPIDEHGHRTAVYDRVKEMNAEIRALSPVFFGSRVESIGHTGAAIPAGATPYHPASPVASLKTEGNGAIVSLLARDKHRFLVIVNRDFQHPMPTTIEFDHDAKVQRVEKDASLQPVESQRQSITVDPGDALIFTWD
jgi:hypothetical protein